MSSYDSDDSDGMKLDKEDILTSTASYRHWRFRVEHTLKVYLEGGWEMLQPDYVKPTDPVGLARWEHKDWQLRIFLIRGISHDAWYEMSIGTSNNDKTEEARVMWKHIAEYFAPTDHDRKLAIERFLAVRCGGPRDVEAYIKRHKAAIHDMRNFYHDIDSITAAAHFISSLPARLRDVCLGPDGKVLRIDQVYTRARAAAQG